VTDDAPTAAESAAPIRVLGIAGSLRARSFNRALLRTAIELAPPSMRITTFDRLGEIPHYNADLDTEPQPDPVPALKRAIQEADAILIATPEYNYSIPGVLKNAIDWASRPIATTPLRNKPAAIMGAAGGRGGTVRAQQHLRQMFVYTQTYPLMGPEVAIPLASEKFDASLQLIDDRAREVISRMLEALVAYTRRMIAPLPLPLPLPLA
jgi:chromate reductase